MTNTIHAVDYLGSDGARKIRTRLALLRLNEADRLSANRLQDEVIIPNVESIISDFYVAFSHNEEFDLVQKGIEPETFKRVLTASLLTLGMDYDTPKYFMDRLRVGLFYARLGSPLSLLTTSYCLMQQLLIDRIPARIRGNKAELMPLIQFILKILALDMSLNVEAYHIAGMEQLQASINTLRDEAIELEHRASIDGLTHLPNHAAILVMLQRLLNIPVEQRTPLCLIMADIDFFKKVNDTYGHQAGDEVLRQVAARICSAVRDFDKAGRYGGEEFLAILPNTDLDTAKNVAERIRCKVAENPIQFSDDEIRVTISLGISCLHETDEISTLIGRADAALYAAKNAGRNRVMDEV